jgi:hypothetical protein
MKIRKLDRKISLNRETIRSLASMSDLKNAQGGAVASSFCTRTHPHCDTVAPCAE